MRRATAASHIRRRKVSTRDQLRYPSAGVAGGAFYVSGLDQSIQFFGDLLRGLASGMRRHICCNTIEGARSDSFVCELAAPDETP